MCFLANAAASRPSGKAIAVAPGGNPNGLLM